MKKLSTPSPQPAAPTATGYAVPLGDGMTAYAHGDGALTLEAADGGALDLSPLATRQLADLLTMSGAQRAAVRRRQARAAYADRWKEAA